MTTKTKTKSKTTKTVGPSHGFDLDRFKNMVIVALIAVIIGATAAFTAYVTNTKSRIMSEEQAKYLYIFPELADAFVKGQDINTERGAISEMTGYGVSEEDGAFYINFDFYYLDEIDPTAPEAAELHKGTVYFWEDAERPGHYSYAYSYEK